MGQKMSNNNKYLGKKWVIGNWKMNPANVDTVFEFCQEFAQKLSKETNWQSSVVVGIAPSFVHLGLVDYCLSGEHLGHDKELPIVLVSQDVSGFGKQAGAFTGDVSAMQISDLAECTLIGHSERRQYHGEDDELLIEKIKNAFDANLSVVYCIGETKQEYERGETKTVLEKQLKLLVQFTKEISSLEDTLFPKLIVAYEPVWAIGTGLTPTLDEIKEVHHFVGQTLSAFEITVPIIYGGSVNDKNAADISSCQGVDGVLVGGASLRADSFVTIIQAFA